MEYCPGGTLATYIAARGTLPEESARHITLQLGASTSHALVRAESSRERSRSPHLALRRGFR